MMLINIDWLRNSRQSKQYEESEATMAVERDELMQMMIAGSGDSDNFPLNQREISFGNDEPAEQIIDSSSEEDHHISASFK